MGPTDHEQVKVEDINDPVMVQVGVRVGWTTPPIHDQDIEVEHINDAISINIC